MKNIQSNTKLTFACLFATVFIQGCAFTNANLDISLPVEAELRGPISAIQSRNIRVGEVVDTRIDKERIGWKKNGYGQNTADILTTQPVEEILRTGIQKTLEDNGHTVTGEGLQIETTLNNFWFEFDVNFWTVEFIGNIEAIFVLLNATGTELYRNTYSGSYSEKSGAGGEKTWARVMSKTLEALLEDFAFDEDLAETLESYTEPEDADTGSLVEAALTTTSPIRETEANIDVPTN